MQVRDVALERGRRARPRRDARLRPGTDRGRRAAVPRAVGGARVADARDGDGVHHHRPLPIHHRADAAGGVPRVELLRALAVGDRAPRRRAGDPRQPGRATGGGPAVAGDADVGRAVPARRPGPRAQPGHERPHPGAPVLPPARRHGRAGGLRLAQPVGIGGDRDVRRARARVHRRFRRLRAVRPCRRPHRHRRLRRERPGEP